MLRATYAYRSFALAVMADSSTTPRRRCGHCDQLLTTRVFKRHRDIYYNHTEKSRKHMVELSGDESEIDMRSSCTMAFSDFS